MKVANPTITLLAFFVLISATAISCATKLPIKVNSVEDISFQYESQIIDGVIKTFEKDKDTESKFPSFKHAESATLKKKVKEYMESKFEKLSPGGSTNIKVTLKEFRIEQYHTKDATQLLLLSQGNIAVKCVAKVKVILDVNRNGEEFTELISVMSEEISSEDLSDVAWDAAFEDIHEFPPYTHKKI